jgi:hypothetical protein
LNIYTEGVSFVKTQPGLENIDTDPDLLNDPAFASFLSDYSQLKSEVNSQQLNSSGSYEYFMNISDEYASFVVLMAQTSKAVQAKKAAKNGES